jgi:hypothetical protein
MHGDNMAEDQRVGKKIDKIKDGKKIKQEWGQGDPDLVDKKYCKKTN